MNTRILSSSAKEIPHTTVRRIIYTQVQSADVFRGVTSPTAKLLLESFLLYHLSAFSEAVSFARLVEAEIVSPYSGILINTDVGNPTAPLIVALGR